MRKTIWTFAALALAVMVAGCASSFNSDVTRFHRLTQPAGESFVVQPMDPENRGSLEFAQYAADVSNRMVALGYHLGTPGTHTDLTVRLGYMVDEGRTAIRSYSSSFYGGYGWGGYGWGRRGFFNPYYGGYWGYPGFDEPDIRSYVVYGRKLAMDIDRNGPDGKPVQRLFEGRVESHGSDNRLTEVMPYMIAAMFKDFPGASGVTQTVKIPLGK
ncbi:DUF4136 domain-containing protein [Govanella unica]|uniref:DUF4136 domain-containing protein n=1 Tax=Govanella unica TaxID=2975056 RepID=A0A9X3U071_9PROT|nr:DUF4136 domain-containing protein [Govania unica]MDA5194677.1 DUF4136 domain-containing protein [Govania unica]